MKERAGTKRRKEKEREGVKKRRREKRYKREREHRFVSFWGKEKEGVEDPTWKSPHLAIE
jgi:hypothetical protein